MDSLAGRPWRDEKAFLNPVMRGDVVRFTSTALVIQGGRVLLGKRTSRVRFARMWDAFGGHREAGETPAHTLVRELFEELGIRVTAARFLHEYEDQDSTSKETYHHHLYLVTG